MDTPLSVFKKKVSKSIDKAFGDFLSDTEKLADMAPCSKEGHGHYQCNSALRLSKVLRKSPREIAKAIVKYFDLSLIHISEPTRPY